MIVRQKSGQWVHLSYESSVIFLLVSTCGSKGHQLTVWVRTPEEAIADNQFDYGWMVLFCDFYINIVSKTPDSFFSLL